jgi:AhpD family alkylhydroperoxidase
MWSIGRRRHEFRAVMRGRALDPAFRERLMLAVTQVNGCRMCSFAHSRMALSAGLSQSDINDLAAGEYAGSPPEEIPALLYAQHWAESDASPDPEVRQQVVERYGDEKTSRIEVVLQMIRVGNLMGNTWDYLLYRVSRGRLPASPDGRGGV